MNAASVHNTDLGLDGVRISIFPNMFVLREHADRM